MSLPNYLSAIKSSGIYRFVWDKSEIEGVDAETLRLVVGYSEKGPFNTPMYIKSASEFKTAFGGISRKLEKRGVFFHRLALQALLSGPIIALNLKKFSNDPDSPYDKVEAVALNASGDTEMTEVTKLPVEGVYNKVRFWNLSPEAGREALGSGSYISIFETDDSSTSKSFIIRGFKPAGYDITIKQWYSNFSEEMPEYYEPIADTLLNQYFAEIYVFEGQFTEAMAKSKELAKYFNVVTEDSVDGDEIVSTTKVVLKPYILNAFGERIDTLQALASDKNSNFIKMYRGITLPEFKDNYNNYISLNLVFNSDTYLHKLMMDFNTDLFDDESIDIKDLLNTAGWYNSDLASWNEETHLPNGLQLIMNTIYDECSVTGVVPDYYYSLPTGIKVLGNNNLVPDGDLVLIEEDEAWDVTESESKTFICDGLIKADKSYTSCTIDGDIVVTDNAQVLKKMYLANVSGIVEDAVDELGLTNTELYRRIVDEESNEHYEKAEWFNCVDTYYKNTGTEEEPVYEEIHTREVGQDLAQVLEHYGSRNIITFGIEVIVSLEAPNEFNLLHWVDGKWEVDCLVVCNSEIEEDEDYPGTTLEYKVYKVNDNTFEKVLIIEKVDDNTLLGTNGTDLYRISNNGDGTWTYSSIELPNSVDMNETSSPAECKAIFQIYSENEKLYTALVMKYTEGEAADEPAFIVNYEMNGAEFKKESDKYVCTAFNQDDFEENTDRGKIYKNCLGITKLYDAEDGTLDAYDYFIADNEYYVMNLDTDSDAINTFKLTETNPDEKHAFEYHRFGYDTKTYSSDKTKGGDVQFLTMKNCYTNVFGADEDLIVCDGPHEGGEPIFTPYADDVEIFVTDSFGNYGLQVGDKFLGKDNQVATLVSIEDYETEIDSAMTDAPIKVYTFSCPLQFMALEYNDISTMTQEVSLVDEPESADMILIKLVNPFGGCLCSEFNFTYLRGFDYSNPKPASTSQYDKLQWQRDILDTLREYNGLRIGLTEKKDIDYRYIVDTFESFVESECKSRLSLLAKEKDNCLALLNFPFIETFRKCNYTSFTDDKGQLDINYIAQGGNPRKPMAFKFSLPSENNGASWCSFNTAVVLSDGTIKTTIPSAALVSNNFMEKYVSRQPYYIVAGPNYGKITDYQLVGPDFNFGRADLDVLEPFGVNAMVYVPRIGTYINSNQTAKQNPVTALSKINIRELVIYLQDEIEKLLQSYQWEFNNQTLRDTIKTKADTICGLVKANGGIYDYLNVCDSSNNPPEVIDNEMLVLSTSIEGARGAGKMVQELTLYKTGGLQAMINNG